MKIRIEPYKTWSGGAKKLGVECGILRATKRQVAKHGDFDVIINWGRTERRFNGRYFNDPASVGRACDKKACLEILAEAEVPIPDFTDSKVRAQEWLDGGDTVVARTMLRANGGRGIVLCSSENGQALPRAPLYTKYFKKADEYRVHVFRGEVIDVQMKRRRLEVDDDDVDWQIRNGDNGWVFAREDVDPPDCVLRASIDAVGALALDFGAVDVGYNRHYETCAVFEVNTAPGLEGSTLGSYRRAFESVLPNLGAGAYRRRRAARAGN